MTGFPVDLTIALTGVTHAQLANWRRTGLLVPEVSKKRPPLYATRPGAGQPIDLEALPRRGYVEVILDGYRP